MVVDLLDKTNLINPEVDWNDYITNDLIDGFGIHVIYLFASLFPKNL